MAKNSTLTKWKMSSYLHLLQEEICMQHDVIVIGGGTVGAAIAYGLARQEAAAVAGCSTAATATSARRAPISVWSGCRARASTMPAYQAWTGASVDLWPDFDDELAGTDADRRRSTSAMAACSFCLGEEEFEDAAAAPAAAAQPARRQRTRTGRCSTGTRSSKLLPKVPLGARRERRELWPARRARQSAAPACRRCIGGFSA